MRRYASFDAAVADALELSRAMTFKAAYAGLPYGGGKAVIDGDPASAKTEALLLAYGRAVEELGGRFFTGGDMGIAESDLVVMARATRFVGHTPADAGVDASDLTAIGVAAAIGAVAARLGKPVAGLVVAIQGVGEVGSRLARRLARAGARLVLADEVAERASHAAGELDAEAVDAAAIYDVPCDVFSPNAAGGVLTEATIERLACNAVCGAANNPLADPLVGFELAARGVLYAPDFVVNAGGLLSLLFETGATDEAGVVARVARLGADLAELLAAADAAAMPPFRLAERRVREKLAAARGGRVPAAAAARP
jgi:leucine dehydrogenase